VASAFVIIGSVGSLLARLSVLTPMGELITSRLPVIGSEPQQFRQADFNDASRKPLPRPVPVAPRAVNNRI